MEDAKTVLLKIVLASVITLVSITPVKSKLADYITICSAKDPALEKCLISSGQKLFKEMEKGIPEFGIKPVDPMAVPQLGIHKSEIGMSLVLTNSTHRGLAQATINSAKADPQKQEMEFKLTLPMYTITGQYDINGKVMLLPIKGQGDSNITLTDIDVTWRLKGDLVERDGQKYLDLKDFQVTIKPKMMHVHFDNLFNGNQLLGQTMNDLLNSQWSDVFRRIKTPLEKSFGDLLFKFGNKIFSKTPYNELFTDL